MSFDLVYNIIVNSIFVSTASECFRNFLSIGLWHFR